VSVTTATIVFAAGIASVLAAGFGNLPLYFLRAGSAPLLGGANAVAAGVMASVSLGLALEGTHESAVATGLGIALGAALVLAAWAGSARRVVGPTPVPGLATRGAVLVVAVMAAHSLAEGVAVGSSFGAGESLGVVTAVAIAAHKSAEGFAIGLVLVSGGAGLVTAVAWSMATALPLPIVAVPAFAFVEAFASVLPLFLGLAAGAMTAVVVLELLPEARRQAPISTVVLATGTAFVATTALQLTLAW
jgi:zinc transporter ZupT